MNKTNLIFVIILCHFLGCINPDTTILHGTEGNLNLEDTLVIAMDTFLLSWDNRTFSIIEDAYWMEIEASFQEDKMHMVPIINIIADTSIVGAILSEKKIPLRKGDLAYIAMDKLHRIPVASFVGITYDYIEDYPNYNNYFDESFFRIVHTKREPIRDKIYGYYHCRAF